MITLSNVQQHHVSDYGQWSVHLTAMFLFYSYSVLFISITGTFVVCCWCTVYSAHYIKEQPNIKNILSALVSLMSLCKQTHKKHTAKLPINHTLTKDNLCANWQVISHREGTNVECCYANILTKDQHTPDQQDSVCFTIRCRRTRNEQMCN